MSTPWPLAISLVAAFMYVAAALSLKRASDVGAGLWHTAFVSNLVAAVLFQGLLPFGGQWPPLGQWWQPVVVALLFLSGQVWTFYSLQNGDVSVATPVLGLKIILVGVFTTVFIGEALGWPMWLAAALATMGIALLNRSGARVAGARVGPTILSAALAASSYALFDVLVQKWSPEWGLGRFLPACMAFLGLFSLALIPFFPSPLRTLDHTARRWLGLGGTLLSMQSLVFVSTIAHFGQATACNVVYSSRGLWSILAVMLLGHWFHSAEGKLGPSILRWRLFGAAFLFGAILLVLVS